MWLFGYSRPEQSPSEESRNGNAASSGLTAAPANLTKADKKAMEAAVRFDSSAFERAAQAAKTLENSRYAKEALEISKQQEITRQQEQAAKIKEYEAAIEQAKVEEKRIHEVERRKTLQEESKQHQIRAQYQDQLAKKRYEEQLLQQERSQEQMLKKQEESLEKQEAMRRATLEYEANLKEKNRLKIIEAEAMAKAKAKRENKDITFERIRLEAAEYRTTTLERIKTIGSVFGTGFDYLVSDRERALSTIGGISLLALGVYTAKRGTSVAAKFISDRIVKPSLVNETSRISMLEAVRHPILTASKAIQSFKKPTSDVLSEVVLSPELEKRLRDIVIATKNARRHNGNYINMMFYGPPGTGKTLFSKKLAMSSGMDYAILTGGDIFPLGKNAVGEINKVFDWANTSRKGVVLFIDEADAFLHKRPSVLRDEGLRAALNAFLYRTSVQSKRIMVVLSTNVPLQFDSAINDRMDAIIEFGLPGLAERERLVRLYFDKFVLQPALEGHRQFVIDQFDYGALCSKVASRTAGFSGRALSKLAIGWQYAAFASEDGKLTEQMCLEICNQAVKEHKQKMRWLSKEERTDSMMPFLQDIQPLDHEKTAENSNKMTVTEIEETKENKPDSTFNKKEDLKEK